MTSSDRTCFEAEEALETFLAAYILFVGQLACVPVVQCAAQSQHILLFSNHGGRVILVSCIVVNKMTNIHTANEPGPFGNLGKSLCEIQVDIEKKSIKSKVCSTTSYEEKIKFDVVSSHPPSVQ